VLNLTPFNSKNIYVVGEINITFKTTLN